MKDVTYKVSEVTNHLSSRIAKLEQALAIERASKKAIVNYAEELERKVQALENIEEDAE